MTEGQHATAEQGVHILFDHLCYLVDQVRRLRAMLGEQGLRVPDDLGTLGPCPLEDFKRLVDEATETYLTPGDPP